MVQKPDICPHCGGTNSMECKQVGQGSVTTKKALTLINAKPLYHVICLGCGTVIRSYIEDPQDWAKQ